MGEGISFIAADPRFNGKGFEIGLIGFDPLQAARALYGCTARIAVPDYPGAKPDPAADAPAWNQGI
ncbi:hypothetical protein D3C80_1866350 [compost metagenome]